MVEFLNNRAETGNVIGAGNNDDAQAWCGPFRQLMGSQPKQAEGVGILMWQMNNEGRY